MFLPAENKILEVTLALSCYFSRNGICAAEYHLGQELERLSVENTWRFGEFYDNISQIVFSSRNTHQRLYETALQRSDLRDSSTVFLVLSSWDAHTDELVKELEMNGLNTVICFIGDDGSKSPDLSYHKNSTLVSISPFRELSGETGE